MSRLRRIPQLGEQWGRLTVTRIINFTRAGYKVEATCQCQNQIELLYRSLYTGNTQSCGCLRTVKNKLRSWAYE